MKRAILMSIQPAWLVKILNGEKTEEIRKTMPKCELPIDVYLYCTKGKPFLYEEWDGNEYKITYTKEWQERANEEDYTSYEKFAIGDTYESLNGLVVAKFTLNKVEQIPLRADDIVGYDDDTPMEYGTVSMCLDELLKSSCLSYEEAHEYLDNAENGYAYHIDNLVIFDKPMELSEFEKEEYYSTPNGWFPSFQPLTKAPQSWQYVYVKGE